MIDQPMHEHHRQRAAESGGHRQPDRRRLLHIAPQGAGQGGDHPGAGQQSRQPQPRGEVKDDVVRVVEIGFLPGGVEDVSPAISVQEIVQAHSQQRLIADFDKPATPYSALRRAGFGYDYDDYAHLARADEWSAPAEVSTDSTGTEGA